MNGPIPALHPKAEAAQVATAKNRARREILTARIKAAVRDGLHFVISGNYTICYKVDRRDIVFFSTAVKHPTDKHDALVAKHTALCRFEEERYVTARIPKYFNTPKQYLTHLFF